MRQRDIIEKLMELANLKNGDPLPLWLYDDSGSWAEGMSEVLREAIEEMEALRKIAEAHRQRSIQMRNLPL